MPKPSLDKATKKAILYARSLVEAIAKADSNEAETRKRIDHILENLMGYDTFKHITQEYAIHGTGDAVHCDIAIQLGHEETSKPDVLIEVKRVNIDLSTKHIRQAASYAIDIGCEWILLTNSKEWKLYHITFGQPPQTKLIESWDLLNDNLMVLAQKFEIVSYKNLKKQGLDKLWQKRNVLTALNLLKTVLSEESIRRFQRGIKKDTGISVSPEDIVGAFRHLLNEAALIEMDKTKICLPAKRRQVKTSKATKSQPTSVEQ
ncbi:MAG: type I restriction enzyme HsdR N-terminal domain-containing protein [Methanocellales archaeon]|nr:type I restriction enzyme HsdR N-terminal domain-containing protein [Methanocellales archaeon]MDD3291195.1 type I restriction enzyme HsdR N-terminal domain-containing protein [Methanocellales archaeon]MDD5235295.1 type I restriction enzyme HsdR N-terminal domain-containing protein [Methanocellales archaeon]MDD5484549.1 type I restriction enzyme HsdR N-terminal domain-containing protein [Methanocellales archaeon]